MSSWSCPVLRLPKFGKHPKADTLSIVNIQGACIFKTGEFQEGDLVVYVPVDTVFPEDRPEYEWLGKDRKRLRAVKLRGIFSTGLLLKAPEGLKEGDDAGPQLGLRKWEPPELPPHLAGLSEPDPGWGPVYDIEGYRKYPTVLRAGEPVQVTEKLHGCNGRFAFVDGRLWVGSHRQWKKDTPGNLWWEALRANPYVREALEKTEGLLFYGEVFGKGVQDMTYGRDKPDIRFFDVFNIKDRTYMDARRARAECISLGLKHVPVLFEGEWSEKLLELVEGNSTLYGGHIREGIVVKPLVERFDVELGRVILKHVSEKYLLRKEGTDYH